MKKINILMLAAISALTMAACGSSKPAETAAPAGAATEADSSAASAETTATEEKNSSYAGKTLIMGTNAEFPPYEYHEGDKIIGIDAEIAAAIAAEMGASLEISDMAFDAILPAVQSGKIDFGAAGMTITEERLKNVDFSDTYASATQAIIVPEGSEIMGPDDLAGKLIGVQQGTTGDLYASDDFGDENVQRFPKGADAIQALSSDKVDAVIIDNSTAKALVERTSGLQVLDTAYAEEEYAICVKKGNEELLNGINDAIAKLKESGALDEIVAKYIKAE